MRGAVIVLIGVMLAAAPCEAQKMTYEQARSRIPERPIPEWWVTDLDTMGDRLQTLETGQSRLIARSPGDRPIWLVTYGPEAQPAATTNFNSAVAARQPSAYVDKDARPHPVLLLLGPVHGQETEGLVSLIHLIEIMETGKDLRGREHGELQRLGQRCRLLVIPTGNPDGLVRFEPRTSEGMTIAETEFWGMGTWDDDSIAMWPDSKRIHPHLGPEIGFLGCYFNDRGVNPMHDEFFAPMSTEAPAILQVARREGPDLAVSLHSHAQVPAVLRPAYVPLESQQVVADLAEDYYARLASLSLPHGKVFSPRAEGGKNPSPFNLVSAIYHTSGAHTFTFESPRGLIDEKACQVSFDEMLDLHLALFETMMRVALKKESDEVGAN